MQSPHCQLGVGKRRTHYLIVISVLQCWQGSSRGGTAVYTERLEVSITGGQKSFGITSPAAQLYVSDCFLVRRRWFVLRRGGYACRVSHAPRCLNTPSGHSPTKHRHPLSCSHFKGNRYSFAACVQWCGATGRRTMSDSTGGSHRSQCCPQTDMERVTPRTCILIGFTSLS